MLGKYPYQDVNLGIWAEIAKLAASVGLQKHKEKRERASSKIQKEQLERSAREEKILAHNLEVDRQKKLNKLKKYVIIGIPGALVVGAVIKEILD